MESNPHQTIFACCLNHYQTRHSPSGLPSHSLRSLLSLLQHRSHILPKKVLIVQLIYYQNNCIPLHLDVLSTTLIVCNVWHHNTNSQLIARCQVRSNRLNTVHQWQRISICPTSPHLLCFTDLAHIHGHCVTSLRRAGEIPLTQPLGTARGDQLVLGIDRYHACTRFFTGAQDAAPMG